MVVFQTAPAQQRSYLNNRIQVPSTVNNMLGANPDLAGQTEQATEAVFRDKYSELPTDNFAKRVVQFGASAGIDLVDTLASVLPNVERNDVWAAAKDIGMDGLADFQARNKSGVELGSGILLSVGTEFMVAKYAYGAMTTKLMQSTALTNSALTRMAKFVPEARKSALLAQESDAAIGQLARVTNPATRAAIKGYYTAAATQTVGKSLATEAAIVALGHNNEAIWSDDMANNAFWFGLGVLIPGGVSLLQTRAEMRAAANSAKTMEIRRKALDSKDWISDRDKIGNPNLSYDPDATFKQSSLVTELAYEARQAIPDSVDPALRGAMSQQVEYARQTLQSELAKFATNKIELSNAQRVSFDIASGNKGPARHIIDGLEQDPSLMQEVLAFGTTSNVRATLKSRNDAVNKLLSSVDPDEVKEGRRLNEQQPEILINGRWYDGKNKDALDFADFDPRTVKITKNPLLQQDYNVVIGKTQFSMNTSAKLPGKPFSQKTMQDRLGSVKVLKGLSSSMRSGKPQFQPKYFVTDKDDWMQHEFALFHQSKSGQVDFSKSNQIKSKEELQFAALKGKIQALKDDKLWKSAAINDNWTRKRYNLPEASQVERIHDGTGNALNTVLSQVDSGAIKTYAEAQELYNDLLNRHEMVQTTRAKPREMTGDMWTFNENTKGDWYEPVLAYHEVSSKNPQYRGSRQQLADELAMNKNVKYWTLGSMPYGGKNPQLSVVNRVNQAAHMTPEGQASFNIGGAADNQVTDTGQRVGAEMAAVLPQTTTGRDSAMKTGSVKLNQGAQNIAQDVTKAEHLLIHDDAMKLSSSVNKHSNHLYNNFRTYVTGFDFIDNGHVRGTDNMWRFTLDHNSKHNIARMGRPIQKGEFLTNPITGKEIVLDDIGMGFAQKYNEILKTKLYEDNLIRSAMGLSEIKYKPWFFPSEDTKGKLIAFVIDKDGHVLPDRSIVAESVDDFNNQKAAAYAKLKSGEFLHSQHELSYTQDIYDSSQAEFINNGFVGRKNVSAQGKLTGEKIRQNMVENDLKYLQDKNVHLANATLRTIYADQIQIAKMRREMTRIQYGLDPGVAGRPDLKRGPKTVWDDYLQNIAGPSIAQVPKRAITQGLDVMGEIAQKGISSLQGAWYGMRNLPPAQVQTWAQDFMSRFGGGKAEDDFAKMTAKLGNHMPYEDLDHYITNVSRVKKPADVQAIASQMNRWDASWRLRYMEIPNAAMNLLGIIANMPAILANSKTPVIGQLTNGSGKNVGIVDTIKILIDGTNDSMRGTWTRDWDYAKSHGGLDQGVAEIREIMSTIQMTSGEPGAKQLAWRKAFLGDKSLPQNLKPFSKDWVKRKGIDGMLAVANDTTERWSRTWAHGIGLKLADLHGITGDAARFNFANSIADQAIANYSPLNRGEVFQSAFGSLFGLYQTYAMNYTGRMFRYLEQGDYKALMRQAAMQTAMFGVGSNIGFNQLEFLEDKFTGDEATISDMIYSKFGPMVGSTLAHGGVADLAELFGAPSGIALYQRADTNVRFNFMPTDSSGAFDLTKMSAALGTVSQLASGTTQMMQAMWNDDSITTGQRISEIAANMMPNRFLKGVMTVGLNDGYETDKYGAVTSVNQGIFESMVRMSGLRTTRQQDEIDMYYANRSSLDKQASRMEQLREETRALVRAGKFESNLAEVFESYTQKGGDPTMFKPWVRQILESSTSTRAMRDMQKALNSTKMQALNARYGYVDQ